MYKNILVPVTFDEKYDTQAALLAATGIAAPLSTITLLNVMEELPEYASMYMSAEFVAKARENVDHKLAALANGIKNAKHDRVNGKPAPAIVEYAEEHDIDCIVVASHRPTIQDYFVGSTADRVVRHAKCSVMVVR